MMQSLKAVLDALAQEIWNIDRLDLNNIYQIIMQNFPNTSTGKVHMNGERYGEFVILISPSVHQVKT